MVLGRKVVHKHAGFHFQWVLTSKSHMCQIFIPPKIDTRKGGVVNSKLLNCMSLSFDSFHFVCWEAVILKVQLDSFQMNHFV